MKRTALFLLMTLSSSTFATSGLLAVKDAGIDGVWISEDSKGYLVTSTTSTSLSPIIGGVSAVLVLDDGTELQTEELEIRLIEELIDADVTSNLPVMKKIANKLNVKTEDILDATSNLFANDEAITIESLQVALAK